VNFQWVPNFLEIHQTFFTKINIRGWLPDTISQHIARNQRNHASKTLQILTTNAQDSDTQSQGITGTIKNNSREGTEIKNRDSSLKNSGSKQITWRMLCERKSLYHQQHMHHAWALADEDTWHRTWQQPCL
jgi:hypothetical protein